jgi:hypothetical protein
VLRWIDFEKCPHCGWDFATDEGERGCAWGACPYLPEELDVFCSQCRFNFLTMEGNPPCSDPVTCEQGAEARSHVGNYRCWLEARRITVP